MTEKQKINIKTTRVRVDQNERFFFVFSFYKKNIRSEKKPRQKSRLYNKQNEDFCS